ncbi:Thiosulfate sulfurtransferase GlpE [Candidatus Gullanella endobia]|uniref:Thiosulfate sulfurtransferase GlpE n=1 Tax=Candidatus Gullanella endobia TaxID=1070130 RepID=A0A143WR76_9ENTR|nr:rhodanese-like domain-containing protein [Candidatus Gullanella endobia]CUX96232.1 Thiosulfate sulfurtransferase GlpE [Candidatus Gullanella endobia]
MKEIIQFFLRHSILSLIWIVLFFKLMFDILKNYFYKIDEIACSETINLINRENAIIIDLRNHEDYLKGHIINSLNLTPKDIKSSNLDELKKEKSNPIIFVCAYGINSHDSAKFLLKAGFKRIYILKEGIFGWNMENLPLVSGK